ncbi:MAG: helix-turn-helix domain-containing protein [Dehalococcoidales bacterium]|nr:helix-turn-helix domain-containing protein [Dehalococcoidales bacterium]
MSDWTFLTNHAVVLSFLAKTLKITARELANAIGVTERTVRKIIADLDEAGYITKKKEGRYIRYSVNPDLPLRHHTHQDVVVGDFLKILGWQKRSLKKRNRASPAS